MDMKFGETVFRCIFFYTYVDIKHFYKIEGDQKFL